MSEVTDIVVPILQRLQADMSDVKRGLTETNGKIDGLSTRMDKFERYLTYSMGLNERSRLDIQRIEADFANFRSRIEELERQD
jgi:chromosome segregation ATPase